MTKRIFLFFALLTGAFPAAYAQCPAGDLVFSSQTAIDNFIIQYPHCTSISGNVSVQGTDITNLDGLSNLESVGGNLLIVRNSSLTNIDGLSNLESIGGELHINLNSSLTNLDGLSSLESIGGDLYIQNNSSLPNIDGLSSLENVGAISIWSNSSLTNIDGLSSLESIGGVLFIVQNSSLTNVDGLSSLKSIGGRLSILSNSQLTDISGLSNIAPGSIDRLEITDNPVLSVCDLPNFCTYLGNPAATHPRNISGNAADCISEAAVIAACTPAPVCDAPVAANTGLTALTASFSWDVVSSATGYEWIVVADGADPATATAIATGSGSGITATGLSENTAYDFYVKTICGTGVESGWSARVDFITPSLCPAGDLTFSSQTAIDNFIIQYPHCTSIPGNVLVEGTDITNLDGLANLESIGGRLDIWHNSVLTNLGGLSSLESVGGLKIWDNSALTNLEGLSSLRSIGGFFYIQDNSSLTNIDGLSSLESVVGILVIWNNSSLTNVDGLSSLESIGGYLYVADNSVLANIEGLSSLESVDGYLYILGNSQLIDISGLSNIAPGSIDGLYIASNPLLSVCDLPNFCTYLGNPAATHPRTISGNAVDCISEAAVIAACTPAPVCDAPVATNTGLTALTASFSWDAVSSATGYEWIVVADGADPAMATAIATGSGSGATATGLSENTVYDFYVKTICGTGVESGWSAKVDFTTTAGPNNISLSSTSINENVSAGSVVGTFSTTPSTGTPIYSFAAGGTDNASFSISGNSLSINISPDYETKNSYSIKVRTTDGEGLVFDKAFTIIINDLDDIPVAPTLTLGSITQPQLCGGTGSVTFKTTGLPDGPISLRFRRGDKDTTATVTVNNNVFTLSSLSGDSYSGFCVSLHGCEQTFTDTVTLINPSAPVATITPGGSTTLCEDDEVLLTASEGATYLWSTGATTRSITVSQGGTYTVTVTSALACVSEAEITVEKKVCNLPPVAICKPVVVMVANSDCYSVVTPQDLDAGSYDLNGDWTRHSLVGTDGIFRPGVYTVTCEVMDPKGAYSTCQTEVKVLDHTPPVALARNLTLQLNAQGQAGISVSDVDAGSHDGCGPVTMSVSRTTFDCSDLGNLQVRLTVTDASGNVSEAISDIRIVDNTPPVVSATNVTLALDENGRASISSESMISGIYDNCGIWDIHVSQSEFTCDDLGENQVEITAEDVQGNRTTATVTVTVLDTLAPVVLTRDITLYLDAAGKASVSPENIDEGSRDNCGIAGRTLQHSAFDCGSIGTMPVQYTVTDGSGNSTRVIIQVTVRDTTAPEAVVQNMVLELGGDGRATLSAGDVDGGSSDNCGIAELSISQTDFGCTDLGRRLVTFTVSDMNGNVSTDRAVVEVLDPNGVCPCSYGVLAFNGITLRNNTVSAGGVGVINSGKKAKLRNTVINREGTFIKAPQSRFDSQSEASTYIRGAAPTPEAFRSNGNKDKKKERVGKGESRTLKAGRYGKIKIGKDATLTFSGGDVFIRSLKAKKNARLTFTDHTTLLVRGGVKLGKNAAVNTGGEQVSIYAGGNITTGNGSELRGYFHSRARLKTGRGGEITSLEGLFVADKIRGGRNTHWSGGGVLCTGNEEPEATLARVGQSETESGGEAHVEGQDTLHVTLYPNPVAYDMLKVKIEAAEPGGTLTLLDIRGNVIRASTYKGRSDTREIDMRKVAPGTYILRVVSGGGQVKTLRVVKEDI